MSALRAWQPRDFGAALVLAPSCEALVHADAALPRAFTEARVMACVGAARRNA
jgi:hypothetical protein